MALSKKGSPNKIKVVKNAGFVIDPNFLAEMILKQVPSKKLTVDQLHSALKSIGVNNYNPDDLNVLIDRLESADFTISK